jgi:hypothetical protein
LEDPTPARNPRLPAQPLIHAIDQTVRDRRTELSALIESNGALWKTVQRVRLRTTKPNPADRWITLEQGEELCAHFGWHPWTIWGNKWDHAADQAARAVPHDETYAAFTAWVTRNDPAEAQAGAA